MAYDEVMEWESQARFLQRVPDFCDFSLVVKSGEIQNGQFNSQKTRHYQLNRPTERLRCCANPTCGMGGLDLVALAASARKTPITSQREAMLPSKFQIDHLIPCNGYLLDYVRLPKDKWTSCTYHFHVTGTMQISVD